MSMCRDAFILVLPEHEGFTILETTRGADFLPGHWSLNSTARKRRRERSVMSRKVGNMVAMAGVFLSAFTGMAQGYADAVVGYSSGTDFTPGYEDPGSALGEPSRETPGEFGGPVDPFSAPYLSEQLVSIGTGGFLTVEFSSPIENEVKNPFGLDFIIFGNAGFVITNGNFSGGGITDGSMYSAGDGAGEVWVSEDGVTYYQLSPALAPALDGLFPTDGSGDFQTPVDPALNASAFGGAGLTEIWQLYGDSGGGAGFDLDWARDEAGEPVNLNSARFIRVVVTEGHLELDGFADVRQTGVPERRYEFDFTSDPLAGGWKETGVEELFRWDEQGKWVEVTWDSSKTNSYFTFPLGMTLHRADDFTVEFTFQLEDIEIGVDPEKPYTFQIAAGMINLASATDPEMYRGAGIHPEHGPRNLVEWAYFPDSGFGATVAPIVVSRDNQMLFSHNYPLELTEGRTYRVEMSFSSETQRLETQMWEDGEPFGMGAARELEPIEVSGTFSDFGVDAFAISSYSDAGQNPPEFAGSILAHARFDDVRIVIRNRTELAIGYEEAPLITFPSESGWDYYVERSTDAINWMEISGPFPGGGLLRVSDANAPSELALYRTRAERAGE